MAYNKIAYRTSATITLLEGQDVETGKDITHSVTLTGLRGTPDADKIMAVVTAASSCFEFTPSRTRVTEVSTLESA